MTPVAIRMAAQAFMDYKTHDPIEIIARRNIKVRDFSNMPNLLGYYSVVFRKQYIGLNDMVDENTRRTVAGHELGHSYLDYKTASSGIKYQDTMLYSVNNARSEQNANLFAAELLISDDDILVPIYYEDFRHVSQYIEEHIDDYHSERARFDFEQEQLDEFWACHSDMPSYEDLAHMMRVDVDLVKFKLKALNLKGLDLPNIPETKSNFLKRF